MNTTPCGDICGVLEKAAEDVLSLLEVRKRLQLALEVERFKREFAERSLEAAEKAMMDEALGLKSLPGALLHELITTLRFKVALERCQENRAGILEEFHARAAALNAKVPGQTPFRPHVV
jgi:hypothetical protein